MTTRAALYARYSSDRQNERSIGDQLAVLTRHAEAKGWTVVAVFTDAAISGAAMANRPGLLNALAAAERGEFDLLLAEDEDRIARNLEHLAHVANRLGDVGAAIATLATDRVGDMHVAFKGLIAQDFLRNLSQKTRRGMAANAERGLATGSRLYGYRTRPGGQVEILEDQAQVIRRIFAAYADGETPQGIAAALNAEGVPGPRGGLWNASTIAGSRSRANGVLHSEIYAGVKVYGRIQVRKDRRTGRRMSVALPPETHQRVPAPHLRIVDQALWDRVQARIRARANLPRAERGRLARKPGLLSGLLRCGACGGAYTSRGGGRLVCSAHREKGPTACGNSRTVPRAEIEARVIEALRTRLLSPEASAAYVRAYHRAWASSAAQAVERRRPIERRLAEISRRVARMVDSIETGDVTGPDMRPLLARLGELERERERLEGQLADLDQQAPEPVALHPGAAAAFQDRIAELQAYLGRAAAGDTPEDRRLMDVARGLIEKVEIRPLPGPDRETPVQVTLHGTLAGFLAPAAPDPEIGPHGGRSGSWGRVQVLTPRPPALRIAC